MNRCCRCNDPGVRAITAGQAADNSATTQYYCYRHHAEAGYSDPAPEEVQALASRLGFSLNAILFLADALQNNAKLCHNAMGCCIAMWVWAERYFGPEAGQVLRAWGVRTGRDIAAIVSGLVEPAFCRTPRASRPRRLRAFSLWEKFRELPARWVVPAVLF